MNAREEHVTPTQRVWTPLVASTATALLASKVMASSVSVTIIIINDCYYWLLMIVILDINECEMGTDECGKGSECENTEGGYECVCDSLHTKVLDTCVSMFLSF